jgi:hypothetical protein
MTVLDVTIGVPTTSDLILLKLAAGGHLDLHDAAALLALADLRERYGVRLRFQVVVTTPVPSGVGRERSAGNPNVISVARRDILARDAVWRGRSRRAI